MLGREGVAGIDRVCNLGAVEGDRGWARNLRDLHLVPEYECLHGTERERKTERKKRQGGRKVERAGADCHLR